MSKITKRELLSFCQLANLDWQFVDMKILEDKESKTLSKALNPNYFLRTKKDIYGEIIKIKDGEELKDVPIYGRDEKGKVALRKKIGMTMELLEKGKEGNSEGKYLDEWEVIEGYDNYKLSCEMMKGSREEEINIEIGKELADEEVNKKLSKEEIERKVRARYLREEREEKEGLKAEVKKILEKKRNKDYLESSWSTDSEVKIFEGKPEQETEGKIVQKATKDILLVLRGQIPEQKLKDWGDTRHLSMEEQIILERWSYLHIPEREIIEENVKNKVERIERKAILEQVVYCGGIALTVYGGVVKNLSIVNNKESLKVAKLSKELFKDDKLKVISYIKGIEKKLDPKTKVIADKLKTIFKDGNIDLTKFKIENIYDLPQELKNKILKDTGVNFIEVMKETGLSSGIEEIKKETKKYLLEEYIPFFAKLIQKSRIKIIERVRYSDTGIRFLLLKKGEESVISIGTGEVENIETTDLERNLEKGINDPRELEIYSKQLQYLCEKLRKEGSKKITLVGLGKNGSLCHIFKLLLKLSSKKIKLKEITDEINTLDKMIEVVTFNPVSIKGLADLEVIDLTESKEYASDRDYYNKALSILGENLKINVISQVSIATIVILMGKNLTIAANLYGALVTLSIGIVIGFLLEIKSFLNFNNMKQFLEILKLNGYIDEKISKKEIKGYLTEKIFKPIFGETFLKFGNKSIAISPQIAIEDIIYLMKDRFIPSLTFPALNQVIGKENKDKTYTLYLEKEMKHNKGTTIIKEEFIFEKEEEKDIYRIKKMDNRYSPGDFTEEKIIEMSEIIEMLRVQKEFQDSYIELCSSNKINNFYVGKYRKLEAKNENVANKDFKTINNMLGINKMLGVYEKQLNINENLFYPFIKVDGEFGEVVREEYVVSALRSHTEEFLPMNIFTGFPLDKASKKKNKKFNLPMEPVIKENQDIELNAQTMSKKDILKTIVDRFKMLEKYNGYYSIQTDWRLSASRVEKGRYFLPQNIIWAMENPYKDSLLNYIEYVQKCVHKTIVAISVNGKTYDSKVLEYPYLTNSLGKTDLIKRGVYEFTQKSIDSQKNKGTNGATIKTVVEGAILKCSECEIMVRLKPTYLKNYTEEKRKVATMKDGVGGINIPKFLSCNKDANNVCLIETSGVWEQGAGHLPINGVDILCSDGEISCKKGGKITIENPGGKTQVSKRK